MRSRTSAASILLAAISLVGLTGCGVLVSPGDVVTEQHEVGDGIHAVELRVHGDLEVALGDEPGLTVTGGERLLERLVVEERDGVLVVRSTPGPWTWSSGDLRLELSLPMLDGLVVDGAGDVDADFTGATDVTIRIDGTATIVADGIDAESVGIEVDGAGEVRAEGRTSTLEVAIDGTGDVMADELRADDVVAGIDGAGEIAVHAERTLEASIDGAGTIRYLGDPHVTSRIDGAGEVVQRDR